MSNKWDTAPMENLSSVHSGGAEIFFILFLVVVLVSFIWLSKDADYCDVD